MSTRKVSIYASNTFRYRIYGSRSWITLRGEEWHDLEFQPGDVVEFGSTSTVDNLKIRGAVKDVKIEDSEITSLNQSFMDLSELQFVEVASSTQITSAVEAFKNSSLSNVVMPTVSLVVADNMFENTKNVSTIQLSPSNLKSANEMFKHSSVNRVESMSSFSGQGAKEMFLRADPEYIGSLDLTNLDEDSIRSTIVESDKVISELDLFISRKRIMFTKKYERLPENIANDDMSIEFDLKTKEYIAHEEFSNEDGLSTGSDEYQAFEFDMKTKEYVAHDALEIVDGLPENIDDSMEIEYDIATKEVYAHEVYEIKDGLPTEIDDNQLIELDVKCTNNDIPANQREEFEVETGLDESMDDDTYVLEITSEIQNTTIPMHQREELEVDTGLDIDFDPDAYTIEIDYNILNNSVQMSRRDEFEVDTGLDTGFDDSTYTLEFDIVPESDIVDPFDDGSCVYMIGKNNCCDRISDDAFPDPANGWDKSYTFTKFGGSVVMSPIGGYMCNIIADAGVREETYKNIYLRVKWKTIPDSDQYYHAFGCIIDETGPTKFLIGFIKNSDGTLTAIVGNRDNDDDDFVTRIESDDLLPLVQNGDDEFSIAIIETAEDSGEYYFVINGQQVGDSFIMPFTDPVSDTDSFYCQQYNAANDNYLANGGVWVFNRTLTLSDIQYLDTI